MALLLPASRTPFRLLLPAPCALLQVLHQNKNFNWVELFMRHISSKFDNYATERRKYCSNSSSSLRSPTCSMPLGTRALLTVWCYEYAEDLPPIYVKITYKSKSESIAPHLCHFCALTLPRAAATRRCHTPLPRVPPSPLALHASPSALQSQQRPPPPKRSTVHGLLQRLAQSSIRQIQ